MHNLLQASQTAVQCRGGHSLTDRLRATPMRMTLARGMTGILSDTVETLLLLRPMIRPISMFCLSWKSLNWPSTSYICTIELTFILSPLSLKVR